MSALDDIKKRMAAEAAAANGKPEPSVLTQTQIIDMILDDFGGTPREFTKSKGIDWDTFKSWLREEAPMNVNVLAKAVNIKNEAFITQMRNAAATVASKLQVEFEDPAAIEAQVVHPLDLMERLDVPATRTNGAVTEVVADPSKPDFGATELEIGRQLEDSVAVVPAAEAPAEVGATPTNGTPEPKAKGPVDRAVIEAAGAKLRTFRETQKQSVAARSHIPERARNLLPAHLTEKELGGTIGATADEVKRMESGRAPIGKSQVEALRKTYAPSKAEEFTAFTTQMDGLEEAVTKAAAEWDKQPPQPVAVAPRRKHRRRR